MAWPRGMVTIVTVGWLLVCVSPSVAAQRASSSTTPASHRTTSVRKSPATQHGHPPSAADLTRVRRQRTTLEAQEKKLTAEARTLERQVTTLGREVRASTRVVQHLERTLVRVQDELAQTSAELAQADARVDSLHALARRHFRRIAIRTTPDPLAVIFGDTPFGVADGERVIFSRLMASDRRRTRGAEAHRDELTRVRAVLLHTHDSVSSARRAAQRRRRQLETTGRTRKTKLAATQRSAASLRAQIARLKATERTMAKAIAAFEAERRTRERERKSASTLSTRDYGALAWPVTGTILYPFGRTVRSNNTVIRWNGMGIAAPVGTPVKAVASGRVVLVGQMGTYGLTVILDHGGGDYSVYGSLGAARVHRGARVAAGQIVGTVGVSDPEFPAHLHFEIRHGGPAVDPARWLKARH